MPINITLHTSKHMLMEVLSYLIGGFFLNLLYYWPSSYNNFCLLFLKRFRSCTDLFLIISNLSKNSAMIDN